MKSLAFHSGFSAGDARRERLYPLFETVFRIPVDTLRDFHARGFWNPTYRSYTFFDGERAVANTSFFSMPLFIQGTRREAAGIQSVMTHPDYRGAGLMKRLFVRMLEEIDSEWETALLFTATPDLYRRFGFREVRQHYAVAPIRHVPKQENRLARKWDFFADDDVQRARMLFQRHTPVSRLFAPLSHGSSFFLHMYNPAFQQKAFFIDDLNLLVVWETKGETLHLYDVIGESLPPVEELCSRLPAPVSRIAVHFHPDRFDLAGWEPVALETRAWLMARGRFELERECFMLPVTASF
jgi:GNAT superfamily N-acetyltransferase